MRFFCKQKPVRMKNELVDAIDLRLLPEVFFEPEGPSPFGTYTQKESWPPMRGDDQPGVSARLTYEK